MAGNEYMRAPVIINGKSFRDVTNVTVAGPVYNYEEALALTKGKHIVTSDKRS